MAKHSNGNHQTPSPKKKKVDFEELIATAWQHYRSYLDSCQEGGEGDVDELIELLEILGGHVNHSVVPLSQLVSVQALVPVLVSVAHCLIAEDAISSYLMEDESNQAALRIINHLKQSLSYFPHNAAAWSMGANFGRMTQRLSFTQVTAWYQQAAKEAASVRKCVVELIESDALTSETKEMMELLLLNQITGVELLGDDDDHDDDDDEENDTDKDESDADDYWSASAVESTSRFMSAMLYSTLQDHNSALKELEYFPLTHRLHPNVWDGTYQGNPRVRATNEPMIHQGSEGVLPKQLYDRVCELFAPDATYWKESNYGKRGYYSYFVDRLPSDCAPSNLMEDVIQNHLLPLASRVLTPSEYSSIRGFEWWVHTRAVKANLGHNLHFDTDEALLSQTREITHPILSSILYLTGENSGGTTVVLDQTQDAQVNAEIGWRGTPKDNTFLTFPGNLLHGVLPCPGKDKLSSSSIRDANLSDLHLDPPHANLINNRLTILVGFWTRRVPDKMKEQKLYGPCGFIPPATEEHSWVKTMMLGYQTTADARPRVLPPQGNVSSTAAPRCAPVWETIEPKLDDESPPLEIPYAIDHRFFVNGAPQYFHRSLFEKDEYDEQEDAED